MPARVQIDVNVYRRKGTTRPEPLPGATSFFQEALQKWKELDTSAEFAVVASELNPITQTLPQLLHHKVQTDRWADAHAEDASIAGG
jgi:U3 small nucleolar RNA-associated protein 20